MSENILPPPSPDNTKYNVPQRLPLHPTNKRSGSRHAITTFCCFYPFLYSFKLSGFLLLLFGFFMLLFGFFMLLFGFFMLLFGFFMLLFGFFMLLSCFLLLLSGFLLLLSCFSLVALWGFLFISEVIHLVLFI